MKKILSFVLAAVLCVTTMSVAASADTVTDNGIFGAILDPDGNVVEYLAMPRTVYLSEIYTLPAKHTLVTYQYEASQNFSLAVNCCDENNNYISDTGHKIKMSVEGANSIGASTREDIISREYTCSEPDPFRVINVNYSENSFQYYNGKVQNLESSPTTIRIVIAVNHVGCLP